MKIKIKQGDTGCCASDCDFKNSDWCNLFFAELFGKIENPTRFSSCMMLTDTNAEFSTQRYEIDKLSKCFGCQRYRKGYFNDCTAGILCKDGSFNKYKADRI